jgi:hypothetical protein
MYSNGLNSDPGMPRSVSRGAPPPSRAEPARTGRVPFPVRCGLSRVSTDCGNRGWHGRARARVGQHTLMLYLAAGLLLALRSADLPYGAKGQGIVSTGAGSSWRAALPALVAQPPKRDAEEPHSLSGGQTEIAQRSRWQPRKRSAAMCAPSSSASMRKTRAERSFSRALDNHRGRSPGRAYRRSGTPCS